MSMSSPLYHNPTEHRDMYYIRLSSQDPVVFSSTDFDKSFLSVLSLVALSVGDAKINMLVRSSELVSQCLDM